MRFDGSYLRQQSFPGDLLYLLSTKIKTALWKATAFAVAHSIRLALSIKKYYCSAAGYCRTYHCIVHIIYCDRKYFT
jgi:hypothetical protein